MHKKPSSPNHRAETQQKWLRLNASDLLLTELSISSDEFERWIKQGWVPSDIGEQTMFTEPERFQIQFVRDIVRSGLMDSQITLLIEKIEHGIEMRPGELAYSFSEGWVAIPKQRNAEDVVAEFVIAYGWEATWELTIEAMENYGDVDSLEDLRERLDHIISRFDDK